MPLKGKSKGKGKTKKGKGKSRKGSTSDKPDRDALLKEAVSGARMWEIRFAAADKSHHEYRDNARKLVSQNESLQNAVNQTERDTVEVIAYLKKEDVTKEKELEDLRQTVGDLRAEAHREKEMLVEDYSQQVAQLEASVSEKEDEVKVIQGELKTVKEFRKKRAEMQQQLDKVQESLLESEEDHQKALSTMEYKFFEEKLRLQKEANRRIAELAGNAQEEAVSNIDERTREVYRENLHMADALALHMEHEETLQKSTGQLEMSNRQLVAEKELNQQMVKEKIRQSRKQKKLIKELEEKVVGLEQSLTMLVKEFDEEKHAMRDRHASQVQQTRGQLLTLQQRFDLQGREMAHVKRLARRILDQRSEVEIFFIDALAQVRQEIAANREQYRCDAQMLYQQQMLEATQGRRKFPRVRTFKQGQDTSTNSVHHDMANAKSWMGIGEGDKVELSDLTWEQKEQVLRLLFVQMNKSSCPSKSLPLLPPPSRTPLPQPCPQAPPTQVFITQSSSGTAEPHRMPGKVQS